MRKTLASTLLLTLILISSLNMAFIARPISAQNNDNEIPENDFLGKTSDATLSGEEKSLQGN